MPSSLNRSTLTFILFISNRYPLSSLMVGSNSKIKPTSMKIYTKVCKVLTTIKEQENIATNSPPNFVMSTDQIGTYTSYKYGNGWQPWSCTCWALHAANPVIFYVSIKHRTMTLLIVIGTFLLVSWIVNGREMPIPWLSRIPAHFLAWRLLWNPWTVAAYIPT